MIWKSVKVILTSIGFIIGGYFAVEKWVIKTANTVVEPVKIQVSAQDSDIQEIKIRTRNIENILMERK